MPSSMRASASFSFGTIKYLMPWERAAEIAPMRPRTGLTLPESSSSPIIITDSFPLSSSWGIIVWAFALTSADFFSASFAVRTAMAIGRSKPLPSFFWSAGLKFISILLTGNSSPEFLIAALIRSLASFTAEPGSPTMSITGKPRLKSASTLINSPS